MRGELARLHPRRKECTTHGVRFTEMRAEASGLSNFVRESKDQASAAMPREAR